MIHQFLIHPFINTDSLRNKINNQIYLTQCNKITQTSHSNKNTPNSKQFLMTLSTPSVSNAEEKPNNGFNLNSPSSCALPAPVCTKSPLIKSTSNVSNLTNFPKTRSSISITEGIVKWRSFCRTTRCRRWSIGKFWTPKLSHTTACLYLIFYLVERIVQRKNATNGPWTWSWKVVMQIQ